MKRVRKPNRLRVYDYSQPGYYFVTICVNKMICEFGKVKNDKIILNKYGEIVEQFLNEIPIKYKNSELDYYVIMPNHIHAIIILNNNVVDANFASTNKKNPIVNNIKTNFLDANFASTTDRTKMLLSKNVGYVKMNSSRDIHIAGNANFKWQRSFYDRIIRNDKELFNIRKYIKQNPLKWNLEKGIVDNLEL